MTAGPYQIVPAGDSALVVEFEERIDPAINARAIAVAESIQRAHLAGVRDVVPTYRTVAVFFDPLRTNYDALVSRIEEASAAPLPVATGSVPLVRIPVCYGGDLGPDLAGVAALAGVSDDEVVRLHSAPTYRVFMLGFVAGFAYMGIVDERIAVPRLRSPRVRVPIGSVAITGVQTGVHAAETPSGWQLIGRTPIKPFDPARTEPFLLKAGDAVQFYPIDQGEYERMVRIVRLNPDAIDLAHRA